MMSSTRAFLASLLDALLKLGAAFGVALVMFSARLEAAPIASAAGLELGGNGTFLTSDKSLGASGLGAGLQGSVFFTMWTDHPLAGKLRIESLSLKEESVQKAQTDYILPGSSLKSMTQSWTLISAGIEKSFATEGQSFFWEALLGYAMGGPSTVTVTSGVPDGALSDLTPTTSSGFALSGGIGIRRTFSKVVTGLMTVRTMFFLGAPYSTDPLANKAFIPLPLLFNIGAEFPFPLGN